MPLSRLAGFALIAGIGLGAMPSADPASQRATREQQAIVGVVDRAGTPVPDLTPADFVVREDDVAREVLRVQQASAPMRIVVLVDTSSDMQLILQDARQGLRAFARVIWAKSPESDVTLMEFGERPSQLDSPTTSAATLDRSIDRLFERPGSGGYLLDALMEATKLSRSREAARPVLVVLAREATEEFSHVLARQVEAAVKDARASFWALVLQEGGRPPQTNEARERDIVLGDTSTRSGGARVVLLNRMALAPQLTHLAARLLAQYVVTYGRPESLIPPTRLDVQVKRPDARVQAAHWTGQ